MSGIAYSNFEEILDQEATRIRTDGREFYYLPFWFENVGGTWRFYSMDNLPEQLSQFIIKARLGNPNPQPEKGELP